MVDYVTIKLDEIEPAEYNPRIISVKNYNMLKENLKKYGLVDPIIVNLINNRIIGGHQRYKALSELGYNELKMVKLGNIGWCFTDDITLDNEDDDKILNLALNRINGEWDISKLKNILTDLSNIHFNMDLTGFSSDDLSQYVSLNIPDEYDSSFDFDDEIGYDDGEVLSDEIINDINIEYTIIFDDAQQQSTWFRILEELKNKYPENDVTKSILIEVDKWLNN